MVLDGKSWDEINEAIGWNGESVRRCFTIEAAMELTTQAATIQLFREQQQKLIETLTVEANRPMPSDAAFDVEVKEHAHGYRMGVGKALMLLKGLA